MRSARTKHAGAWSVKVMVAVPHEQVIVLDADRPVRGEAVFEADADHATPAGVVDAGADHDAGAGRERSGNVVAGDRGAALDVEQGVVAGVADLAGEQAEGIDLRVSLVTPGKTQADIASPVKSAQLPCASRPNTQAAGLPAIADLTTDGAAGCIMAAFGVGDERAGRR